MRLELLSILSISIPLTFLRSLLAQKIWLNVICETDSYLRKRFAPGLPFEYWVSYSTPYPSTRIVTDVAAQSAAGDVGTAGSLDCIGGVSATGSTGAGITDVEGSG